MFRSILYALLILIFFGFLLLSGLFGPEQGRVAIQKLGHFLNWKPSKSVSLVDQTQENIKKFNESYKKIQILREMTLDRNQQSFKDLEGVYQQTRTALKDLLFNMGQLTAEDRTALFQDFTKLHQERARLVDGIIQDQLVMINLNEQMDQQLKAMTHWLIQKAQSSISPTANDVMKMRQYEALRSQLTAFDQKASGLDSMRILFMKKSKDSVDRLDQTNKELENQFRELVARVELATSDQSTQLWDNYQRLENEQRELVANLRTNEEFISSNQTELVSGIMVISKTAEYSSDTQMERFRDNFVQMEERRRELLKGMNQSQQAFLSTRPSMQRLMEDNRYRMEIMREQARQISDQFEQMEEYRKSTTSMLRSMASELKDKNEFASQQVEDVMDKSRDHIAQFVNQMDAAQGRINDFIKNGSQTVLADSPSMHRLKEMGDKNRTVLDDLKNNEGRLRALSEQARHDQTALMQMRNEATKNYSETMKAAKERTDDQKRIMSEKIKDQLQRLKDQRLNQK